MKHQEHILAIKSDIVTMSGTDLQMVPVTVKGADIFLGQRAFLETTPLFRQVIPYTVLMCGEKIAVYARTESGGEARLHGKKSCGFGGHLDAVDCAYTNSVMDFEASVKAAAVREIDEEVEVFRSVDVSDIEILEEKIVSSETEVDAVHIGFVSIIHLDSEKVETKEDQLEILGFFTPSEVLEMDNLENWTRGLCQFLAKK